MPPWATSKTKENQKEFQGRRLCLIDHKNQAFFCMFSCHASDFILASGLQVGCQEFSVTAGNLRSAQASVSLSKRDGQSPLKNYTQGQVK